MQIRKLTLPALRELYHTELKATFPPTELKPLFAMQRLLREGEYIPLAWYADGTDELLGYALLWTEGEGQPALLDYFAVPEALRGRGVGAKLLAALEEYLAGRPMIIEAEAPDGGDEDALRQRRLDFYTRCGAKYLPYDCWLFGVHYRCLAAGWDGARGEALMEAHRSLYLHKHKGMMQKYVHIPYVPGDEVPESIIWSELKDE